MKSTIRFTVLFAAVCGMLAAPGAFAQAFPSKPVRLIVPNPPGGGIDIMARVYAPPLQAILGQPVLVEYKPGAGSALGTEFVARSAPDGHTVGIVVTAHVINPALRKLGFDTVGDLSGVAMTGVSHVGIAASSSLEANTLRELIALAKKNPGKLTYASPGSGSSMHLAGELLKQMAGIDILHVPFKGTAAAYPEVFAGRVDLIIDPLYAIQNYAKAGRLKHIAIASPERAQSAPEIPTVAEVLPGFAVTSVMGVVVPRATPRDTVNRLNAAFVRMLQLPEVKARLAEAGVEPVGNTPAEFDGWIKSEIEKWAKVVKVAGIKMED